jgi:hypothetical protein
MCVAEKWTAGMNAKRLLWYPFFLVGLTGCVATVPVVAPHGKYSQLYLNGQPILEFEYPDAQSCASDSNKTQGLDSNTRKLIADGVMRFQCSPISQGAALKHEFKLINVLTGLEFPSRSVSREACLMMERLSSKLNTGASTGALLQYRC